MSELEARISSAFVMSRKLYGIHPNEGQLSNIIHRLRQIFTDEELSAMEEKKFMRQVERVWPIARYVDVMN